MRFADRYAAALSSAQLRVDETHANLDPVIALGAAMQFQQDRSQSSLAAMLHRVRSQFDRADMLAKKGSGDAAIQAFTRMGSYGLAMEALRLFAAKQALLQKVELEGDAAVSRVAGAVMQCLLAPTCPACSGRAFMTIPGTPTLSDTPCHACRGTGQRGLRLRGRELDVARTVADRVQVKLAALSRAAGKKLG